MGYQPIEVQEIKAGIPQDKLPVPPQDAPRSLIAQLRQEGDRRWDQPQQQPANYLAAQQDPIVFRPFHHATYRFLRHRQR